MSAVPTTPDHTANRLTEGDRARVIAAVAGACAEWRAAGGTPSIRDLKTLARLGANSIGCAEHDLRQSELDWIEARATEAIEGKEPR